MRILIVSALGSCWRVQLCPCIRVCRLKTIFVHQTYNANVTEFTASQFCGTNISVTWTDRIELTPSVIHFSSCKATYQYEKWYWTRMTHYQEIQWHIHEMAFDLAQLVLDLLQRQFLICDMPGLYPSECMLRNSANAKLTGIPAFGAK